MIRMFVPTFSAPPSPPPAPSQEIDSSLLRSHSGSVSWHLRTFGRCWCPPCWRPHWQVWSPPTSSPRRSSASKTSRNQPAPEEREIQDFISSFICSPLSSRVGSDWKDSHYWLRCSRGCRPCCPRCPWRGRAPGVAKVGQDNNDKEEEDFFGQENIDNDNDHLKIILTRRVMIFFGQDKNDKE